MKILSGKEIKEEIRESLKEKIQSFEEKLCLAIVKVGDRSDSDAYIKQKEKFGIEIGVDVKIFSFSERTSEEEIMGQIEKLNSDETVHGIILQLPIPEYLDEKRIIESIDKSKDVDGLTSFNVSLLYKNKKSVVPATARGVLTLLDYYDIPVQGKNVVVVGRSLLAGKPIALGLLNRNATVTICHSHTEDLKKITKGADILIVVCGVKHLITEEYVSKNQIVIDVGIHDNNTDKGELEEPNKKYTGDVDFKEVSKVVSAITPVPGGVGQMTVASLYENLMDVYLESKN